MTWFRSIRVRLTLWYVLLVAVTLLIFSAVVYLALKDSLYANLDESLEARANIVSALAVSSDASDLDIPGDIEGEEFVRVHDQSGRLVFDNASPEFPPPANPDAVDAALSGDVNTHTIRIADIDIRVRFSPVYADGEIVGVTEVGLAEDDVQETLDELLLTFAIAFPLALMVTTIGGILLAQRALSPIARITRAAQRISAEDLSQRIDAGGLPDDELGRLARTFNEMIARLDDSFRRQRQFTADASHELRTPLTAAHGQIEVALQRERSPEEYREVLGRVNSDVDRMIRLVGSLLTLARADAGQILLNREPVSVSGLVSAAVDQVRPGAEARRIEITVNPGEDIALSADQDLLLQLLLNLLDNAIRHSPEGRSVTVSWRRDTDYAEIAVADTGDGIPPEHLPHIFDRFYRAESSRTGASAGLGLSISKWIAEAHGGTLRAESPPGQGATLTIRLPLA